MPNFQELYGQQYFIDRSFDTRRLTQMRQEIERVIDLHARLERPLPRRIFDIGCGLGEWLSLWPHPVERFGYDVSDYATKWCEGEGIAMGFPEPNYIYQQQDGAPDAYLGSAVPITFDLIVMRGVWQHLQLPDSVLFAAVQLLNPGGMLAILATPNSESACYRRWQTLPCLDPRYNYHIPGLGEMCNVLHHWGLELRDVHLPYGETPYADPLRDIGQWVRKWLTGRGPVPCWPGNMMEIYATKPEDPELLAMLDKAQEEPL